MRLNPDCVRDLLLALEELLQFEEDDGNIYYPSLFSSKVENHENLKRYSKADIAYTTLKLVEADYINAAIVDQGSMHCGAVYASITYLGHQFLETIRTPSIWKETKSIAKSVGSFAINVLSNIAVNVITRRINGEI